MERRESRGKGQTCKKAGRSWREFARPNSQHTVPNIYLDFLELARMDYLHWCPTALNYRRITEVRSKGTVQVEGAHHVPWQLSLAAGTSPPVSRAGLKRRSRSEMSWGQPSTPDTQQLFISSLLRWTALSVTILPPRSAPGSSALLLSASPLSSVRISGGGRNKESLSHADLALCPPKTRTL